MSDYVMTAYERWLIGEMFSAQGVLRRAPGKRTVDACIADARLRQVSEALGVYREFLKWEKE